MLLCHSGKINPNSALVQSQQLQAYEFIPLRPSFLAEIIKVYSPI